MPLNAEISVEPNCKDMENTTNKSAGSTKLEINISRDDPIPPKELPVSNAERARKNRPKEKIKIRARKSPM